jgi:hypothetical protein
MANIKIRNLNPGSYTQITSGSFLATALNENEGTQESSTVRATASQIVSGGAVYADFSEELMISGVPVSTGSMIGGKEVLKPGPGGSIEFGDTNTTINIEGPSIFKESVTINKTLDVTEAATFNSTSLFKGDSLFESNTTFGTDATDTSIFNSTSVFNENSSFVKDVAIGGNLAVGGGLDIGGNLTAGGQKVLALDYGAANNGKVLKVVGGALAWATDDSGLASISWDQVGDAPDISTGSNGQVLKIVNGALAWATDDSGLSSVSWSQVSSTPTTLAGYGITDAASAYTLPTADASTLGGIKVGSNLTIANGVLSAPTPTTAYSLPTASASVLGGVKVGSNLTISNGVLSSQTNTSEVQTIIQSYGASGPWQSSSVNLISNQVIPQGGTQWNLNVHASLANASEICVEVALNEQHLQYYNVFTQQWITILNVGNNVYGSTQISIPVAPGSVGGYASGSNVDLSGNIPDKIPLGHIRLAGTGADNTGGTIYTFKVIYWR